MHNVHKFNPDFNYLWSCYQSCHHLHNYKAAAASWWPHIRTHTCSIHWRFCSARIFGTHLHTSIFLGNIHYQFCSARYSQQLVAGSVFRHTLAGLHFSGWVTFTGHSAQLATTVNWSARKFLKLAKGLTQHLFTSFFCLHTRLAENYSIPYTKWVLSSFLGSITYSAAIWKVTQTPVLIKG